MVHRICLQLMQDTDTRAKGGRGNHPHSFGLEVETPSDPTGFQDQ